MAHTYLITRRILFSLSLSLFKEVFLASFFVVLYLCLYCLFDFHDLFNYVLLFAYSWLLRQLFRSYVSDACLFIVLFSYDLMTYAMPGVHSMLLFSTIFSCEMFFIELFIAHFMSFIFSYATRCSHIYLPTYCCMSVITL